MPLAMHLAEAGFVVAVPDLPHWVKPEADAIVALVAAVVAEHKLDALPVLLVGTSAGGLAALFATSRVPRLARGRIAAWRSSSAGISLAPRSRSGGV